MEVAEPLTDAVVCQPVVEGPTAVASGGSAGSSAAPSILPSSPLAAPLQTRYGLDVPATPQQAADQTGPGSSRNSPTTRAHAVETEGSEPKRFKSEEHKKQRINSLTEEREAMIRTVQFGSESYHTLDSYDAEFQEDDVTNGDDVWFGEDEIHLAGVTEQLWSDHDLGQQPPQPAAEIDRLADEVEIQRLLEMQVLVEPSKHDGQAHGRLTTKFVRDWRKNVFVGEGDSRERWMRRSRLVAREYAVTKRDDTFSPATGAHTSNLLPLLYSERKAEAHGHENHQQQGHTRQTCCLYSTWSAKQRHMAMRMGTSRCLQALTSKMLSSRCLKPNRQWWPYKDSLSSS